MKAELLLLLIFSLILSACEKDDKSKTCLVQNVIETRAGSQTVSSTITYDSNNKITQIRRAYLPESPNSLVKTATYVYDDKGRITEIDHQSSFGGNIDAYRDIEAFEYNDLGQVVTKVVYFKHGNNPKTEAQRLEYTYTGPQELKLSKWYFAGELQLTREYTYSNGLMTSAKDTYKDQQTTEMVIRYDDKKNPYSTSPSLLAIKLDLGYPHQHNIVNLSGKSSSGTTHGYNMNYTYSDNGYPVTAQEVLSQQTAGSSYEYSYSCF